MTQARWIFIILCFLLPAATDLLFHNVSVCWLIGCTVIAMIWNFFCGCEILDLVFCLFPGMIVWLLARFSKGIGMGDVLSLIEKAQDTIDESKAKEMEQKLRKAQFGFDDYLESMNQMKNMGGISKILSMMPGMGGAQMKQIEDAIDEKQMARIEAMILSMTPKERANPDILNPSRKRRIADGAGVDISEVNKLVKQFEQSRKMMKQYSGMLGSKAGKRGKFKLPF